MRVETLFQSEPVVPQSKHVTLDRMRRVVNTKEALPLDELQHLSCCRACLELTRFVVRERLRSLGTPLDT